MINLSVLLPITSRYRSESRRDKHFGFSPYSLESLVFRDTISCCWVTGVSPEGKGEKGDTLKRRYVAPIGLSSVKMVADRHKYAAYYNKH